MKKEIIKFYQDKGIPMSLLIHTSKGLPPDQVEAAAVETYQEIQDGLEINEHNEIPRHIWNKAHDIDSAKYKRERLQILNYDRKVKKVAGAYKESRKKVILHEEEISRLEDLYRRKIGRVEDIYRKKLDRIEGLSSALLWVIFVYVFYYKFIFQSLY